MTEEVYLLKPCALSRPLGERAPVICSMQNIEIIRGGQSTTSRSIDVRFVCIGAPATEILDA